MQALRDELVGAAHLHKATVDTPEETRKDDALQRFRFNYTDGSIRGAVVATAELGNNKRSPASVTPQMTIQVVITERAK